MKRLILACVTVMLAAPALYAQESLDEIVAKLNKANYATAMKMFPELEKRKLLGVSEEPVEGKERKVLKFFFRLPLSDKAMALYYCYNLKTGVPDVRELAARSLRPYPDLIAETIDELVLEKSTDNFDKAAAALLSVADIEMHEAIPVSYALYWQHGEKTAFCRLTGKQHAMMVTAKAALHPGSDEASEELRRSVVLYKSLGIGKEFSETLKARISAAAGAESGDDFRPALAFVGDDFASLAATVLDAESPKLPRKSAVHYLVSSCKAEAAKSLRGAIAKMEEGEILTYALSAVSVVKKEKDLGRYRAMALDLLKDGKVAKEPKLWMLHYLGEHGIWEDVPQIVEVMDSLRDVQLRKNAFLALERISRQLDNKQDAELALSVYRKLGAAAEDWVVKFLVERPTRISHKVISDAAAREKNGGYKAFYETLAQKVLQACVLAEEYGGVAVIAHLRWLHLHQDRPSGMWDSDGFDKNCDTRSAPKCTGAGAADCDLVVTSLATLRFLERNWTHTTGLFKKTIRLGLLWLIRHQKDDGQVEISGGADPIEAHAIATKNLCQAYAMTQQLRDKAEKAAKFLRSKQCEDGGWKKSDESESSDVVTTAWAVMALRQAKDAGLEVPDETFGKALKYLDSLSLAAPKARAGFVKVPYLKAVAAAATASFLCGRGKDDERLAKLIDILDKNHPRWNGPGGPVYWYFGTCAMSLYGGEKLDKWANALKQTIRGERRVGTCANGSWNPVGLDGRRLGRVGMTALVKLAILRLWKDGKAEEPK